jgi:glycine dehydrogenase subunit 1
MLHKLGVVSAEELFEDLPARLRYPKIDLPDGISEHETLRELTALAAANATADDYRWFLGAGAYDHFIPSVVPYLASRGEFLTAYTPYQPEVSQGTLQAVYEYQSMIAELTGMEAVNASHYDGATALAEAVLMALRGDPDRRLVLLPVGIHPEYRAVLDTYLAAVDVRLATYAGRPAAVAAASEPGELAALVACYPDFFGRIPDLAGAAEAVTRGGRPVHRRGGPHHAGPLQESRRLGADVVTAEGQSLGNDLSYGGPYLGVMATPPTPWCGVSPAVSSERPRTPGDGGASSSPCRPGAAHPPREGGIEHLLQPGTRYPAGLHLPGVHGQGGPPPGRGTMLAPSHYAARAHRRLPGFSVADGAFFKEFVVRTPIEAEILAERLYGRRIVPGLPLSRYFPERKHELLVCVTETCSRADIDDLAETLREEAR